MRYKIYFIGFFNGKEAFLNKMAIKKIKTIYQFRRDTEANWLDVKDTCIPLEGEPCVTLDGEYKGQIKIGDGVSTWGQLKYIGESGLHVIKIYDDSTGDTKTTVDGKTYDTVEEAILEASAGSEVKLSESLGENTINIDKEIIFNMNGVEVVNNENTPLEIGANGKVTLKDGGLECNKNGKSSLDNNGEVIIDDCNLTKTIDEKDNGYYTGVNHGIMIINSGVFSSPGGLSSLLENGYWDYNSGNSDTGYVSGENQQYPELIVNGGTFINPFYVIKNDDGGKLTINDGMFYGTILHNGIEMTINGGHFNTSDGFYPLSIRNLSDDLNPAKTVINGGVFDGNCKTIIKNSGEKELDVKIKGGKYIIAVDEQYIAEGYEQKYINGWYVVSKKGE